MLVSLASDPWLDPSLLEPVDDLVGVVGAVGEHRLRPPLGCARLSSDRRDRINEVQQLARVRAVGRGEDDRQRHTVPIAEQVVLAARLAPVYGTGAGL